MDIRNVLKRKINFNIDYLKPGNLEENKFMKMCFTATDFLNYISEENVNYDEYVIIKCGDDKLGICSFNIEVRMGIKTARPIIYMTHRKGLKSFMAINSMIYYLFRHKCVDRVELRIYSNNKQMLSMVNKGIFKYEGCIKSCKKIENEYVDMHFYSMLKKEFDLFEQY